MKTLLLGTGNLGKIREFTDILKSPDIQIVSLDKYDSIPEPVESGTTFRENAEIKAVYYAKAFGTLTLADDSGLEVEVLDGKPGVFSARFAGKNATDQENLQKLLDELAIKNPANRRARFVCAICLVSPKGEIIAFGNGTCEGVITRNPSGINGFGYDPIFSPKGFDKTFGELPKKVKRSMSHRVRAAEEIARFLRSGSVLRT